MLKRMFLMLLFTGAFIAGLGGIKFMQIKAAIDHYKNFKMPPDAVTTVIAKPQKWQPVLSSVGSLKAVNGVTVSTDLAGIISEIHFESGKPVKKGDLLVKLDTKQEVAQLASAQARWDLAKVSLTRQQDLLAKKAAAQSEYDSAAAEARQAAAAVDDAKALIARKTIVAPFDGVLGIRQVDVGQYLNVGNPIVTLESLDPIYANFSLPQQELGQIEIGKKIQMNAVGLDGLHFDGEITAIDSRIDDSTRNIQVQATVQNPEGKLRAGMFVNVDVFLPEQDGVIAIPASAITYAPYGDSVYLIKEQKDELGHAEKVAVQQFVKLGQGRGDQVLVLKGVNPGDEVVTAGGFKLQGKAPRADEQQTQPAADDAKKAATPPKKAAVLINNSVLPSNDANPNPPDT